MALQRLEFHFLDRPRSSVLRKRRPGKDIFAVLPFDNNASVEERPDRKSLKGRKVAWQYRRRSRHRRKKGRVLRDDSEPNGVSQSLEDPMKGEGREAGDDVTLCILGSERDATAMVQTAVALEGKRLSQRADLLLRKGYTDLFERSSRAQCQ